LSPVILVDGIPRSISSINPEQIASITVLKDALSTAMLGINGNNGAVLITTRKGSGEGGHLTLTAQTGFQTALNVPQGLSAYNYASLYNEALINNGKSPLYTQADLDAYKNHTDPYGHPNANWQNILFKNSTPYSRYNMTIGDDNNNYRYFLSLDYLNQQGLFNQSTVNGYSTNSSYNRYNVRGNVEVDLSKYLASSLNIFGRIQNSNDPGVGTSALYSNFLKTPNNAYPQFNPNGSLGGNAVVPQSNLYGQLINSGYVSGYTRDAGVDLAVKRSLDDVLKGFWVKGLASFYGVLSQSIDRSKTFQTYQMNIGPLGDTSYQTFGSPPGSQNNVSSTSNWYQQLYTELSAGYNGHFGKNNLQVLLLANNNTLRNQS
jgi:TonB-dependent SusC/RagA subfamily outer membrane receptor